MTGLEGNLDMDHEQRPAAAIDADVLAFIPDVDAPTTAAANDTQAIRPLGRLLSQSTSAKLLLAAAAVLVVAAIVPFLFSKKDSPKPVADGAPAWQPGPASPQPESGPKWNGGSTARTPAAAPDAPKPPAPRPAQSPRRRDLRGTVKPPAAGTPTPLFGDRVAPATPTADERLRTIPPPRYPSTGAPEYAPLSDPRDVRYEARRPAPVDERSYEAPQPSVGVNQRMAVGDPNAGTVPDYRPTEARDYTPSYRREATPDYRREATSDYRREATPDYRREMPPDYRQDTAADYRQDYTPDYRRPPAPDYRQEAPADYRSGATPGLADRRMAPPPSGGPPTGVGQPGVARIEGIIDTPPARTTHEYARPGVY